MPRHCFYALRTSLFTFTLVCISLGAVQAQMVVYTHTSGILGDGFTWDQDPPPGPNNLGSGDTFVTPDEFVDYNNFTDNITFFDDNYQAAGNSGVIDGEAWWGNPFDNGFPQLGLGFYNTTNGGIDSLSFDFAWAIAGEDAGTVLEIEVYDYDVGPEVETYETFLYFDLNESFIAGGAFGGFMGYAGHININVEDLFDDFTNEPLTQIEDVYITVADVATLGGTGEFAIDNVALNGADTGLGVGQVFVGTSAEDQYVGLGTKYLRGNGNATLMLEITNDSGEDTTVTTMLTGTVSDPGQFTNEPIEQGETIIGAGGTVSRMSPSGEYTGVNTVSNDNDANDPDEDISINIKIYDPPQLTDNSDSTIQVDANPTLSLANAAAGPHVGALRAGVEVTARNATGGFEVVGLEVDDFVGAGETGLAAATFNSFGKLTRSYVGAFSVDLQMNSEAGSFLNGKEPVPSVQWDLLYSLFDTPTDTVNVSQDEEYSNMIGVNSLAVAATLIGGTSPATQKVDMDFLSNSGNGATLVGSPVELEFGNSSGLYVLQFTYDASNFPSGLEESDLRVLVLDVSDSTWGEAIDDNTGGGAGGAFFAGSFEDYLSGPGGGLLDVADLSDFGIDTVNGHAWAILDHASVFALGLLTPALAGDYNADGVVDAADYTRWRDNLGAAPGSLPNDVDGGTIGPLQYARWKANFGMSNFSGAALAAVVPEPATFTLVLWLAVAMSVIKVTLSWSPPNGEDFDKSR